tara:strand:+ start:87 stop:605 length:519 start_codon:yes stop_codon:yes gene_type:complete
MQTERTRKPGELAFAALIFATSLILLYSSYGISGFSALSGPGTFPMAATAIMAITSAAILMRTLQAPRDNQCGGIADIVPPVISGFCGLIAVYAVLLDRLGFLLASFLFLLAGFRFLHRGGWLRSLLLTIVSLVAVYIAFRVVFQVILPDGILLESQIRAAIARLFAEGAAE